MVEQERSKAYVINGGGAIALVGVRGQLLTRATMTRRPRRGTRLKPN
jgi:hypothetical protein